MFWNGHDHRYPGMYEPDLSVMRLGRTAPAKIFKKNPKNYDFLHFYWRLAAKRLAVQPPAARLQNQLGMSNTF